MNALHDTSVPSGLPRFGLRTNPAIILPVHVADGRSNISLPLPLTIRSLSDLHHV